ncbi:MAG: metallophosphoesterase family protein [Promethearchaeota archaeon]
MKIGIISDTHFNEEEDKINEFIVKLKKIFKDVDKIIHAGDVCSQKFLNELNQIAPTRSVRGNSDKIKLLEDFIKFSVGPYNIGVIHKLPDNIKTFVKKYNLNILIYGHTHRPLIKGTEYNVLLLNPGSPTKPKAPLKKPGFRTPIARPSVMILNIDENNILSTFIINLKN